MQIGNMPVGLSQIGQPTPPKIKYIFHTVLVISAVVAIILQTVKEIPAPVASMISNILLEVNGLVFALSRLFGFPIENPLQES